MFGKNKVIAFPKRSVHIEAETYKKFEAFNKTYCDLLSEVYLDFYLLGECDQGVISHSGFGLFGILNNEKSSTEINENFYVFANPNNLRRKWRDNKDQYFLAFNRSLLYLEYNYIKIKE